MDVEPNFLKNQSVSAFLEAPPNAPDAVKKVIKKLADMEATQPFLQDYINKKGMANWQKALVSSLSSNSTFQSATSGGDTTYVLAPIFLSDSNIVRSLISARVTGEDVFIKFLEDYQYRTLPTKATAQPGQLSKEDYAYYYFYFTSVVYGQSDFIIKDPTLFKDKIEAILQPGQSIVPDELINLRFAFTIPTNNCFTVISNVPVTTTTTATGGSGLDITYVSTNPETYCIPNGLDDIIFTINPNLPPVSGPPGPSSPYDPMPGWVVNKRYNKNPLIIDDNDFITNSGAPYDLNNYPPFVSGTTLPTINNVITQSDFVGWSAEGISPFSIDYAKAQIAVANYKISDYTDNTGNVPYGQTYQIYTEANGVNTAATNAAIGYISGALQAGIPVVVGIDCRPGAPTNFSFDNSTDHYVVIVGMGFNLNTGLNYFQFYDCATWRIIGTSNLNKLYIGTNGTISGTSAAPYAATPGFYNYTITQVRRSKPL